MDPNHHKISFSTKKGGSKMMNARQPPSAALANVFRGGEDEDENETARREYAATQALLSSSPQAALLSSSPSGLTITNQFQSTTISNGRNDGEEDAMEVVAVTKEVIHMERDEESEGDAGRVHALKEEGNLRADNGDFKGALGSWEEALGLDPRSAVLYELKAQAHMQLEEHLEALKAASRACELEPAWMDAKLTLGRAQISFGEIRGSVKTLSEVCGRQPSNEEAREELIFATGILMELQRKEQDFDLQLAGRAGLDNSELEVARCKRNLLARGKEVPSDCYLGAAEQTSSDDEEV